MKEQETLKKTVRELTLEMSTEEYVDFMRWLSEWSSYEAEIAEWTGENE